MKYKRLWILSITFIVADAVITYWAVVNGHAQEANPAVKSMIEAHGIVVALVGAGCLRIASVALAMLVQRYVERQEIMEWFLPSLCVSIQSIPVIWNVALLTVTFIWI